MDWYENLNNDDDVLELEDYKEYKDALLFCIQVTQTMLDNGTLKTALEAAYETVTNRIMISPQDYTGVLLFGAQMDDDQSDVHFLLGLGLPKASQIKRLKRLIDDPDMATRFTVSEKSDSMLMDVLFDMNRHFINKAPKFLSRRILFITDDDSPVVEETEINKTRVRVEDLAHLKVRIEPLLLNANSGDDKVLFDTSKFYDLVFNDNPPEVTDSIDLKKFIKQRNVLRRSLFNTKLELGPGLDIGVRGYLLFSQQKSGGSSRNAWVYTGGEKPQMVKLESQAVTVESGRSVDKQDLRRTYKFGADNFIPFTNDQIAKVKYFGEPIIRILGFQKEAEFSDLLIHCVRSSMFIYPTDEKLIGSTRAFSALYQSLQKKKMLAVAWVIVRKGAKPTLSVLVPSSDDAQDKETPIEGLHLVHLPFADDIRKKPAAAESAEAPSELVDATKAIFSKLCMPGGFDPQRYPNPRLQWHHRILQAMALQEEVPQTPDDNTMPKFKSINTRVGDSIASWNSELQSCTKRDGREDEVAETPKPKKPKAEAKVLTDEQMKDKIAFGQVSKLTVADLKAWGEAKGVEPAGKLKKDWIEAVEKHYS